MRVSYSNIIEKELRPRWGEFPIASVTREDICDYRAELAARNLAATTLNGDRSL